MCCSRNRLRRSPHYYPGMARGWNGRPTHLDIGTHNQSIHCYRMDRWMVWQLIGPIYSIVLHSSAAAAAASTSGRISLFVRWSSAAVAAAASSFMAHCGIPFNCCCSVVSFVSLSADASAVSVDKGGGWMGEWMDGWMDRWPSGRGGNNEINYCKPLHKTAIKFQLNSRRNMANKNQSTAEDVAEPEPARAVDGWSFVRWAVRLKFHSGQIEINGSYHSIFAPR